MTRHLRDETIDLLLEAPERASDEDRAHLESCEECRGELALARLLDAGLASVPRMVAPEALLRNVMAAVALGRARRRRLVLFGAAAVAASLAAVVVWLGSGGAALVALEAVELSRTLGLAARVGGTLVSAFAVPMIVACIALLVASSAALQRVVRRASAPSPAEAEAG